MTKHVILLTDAHEAPAVELIQALGEAGIATLVEGLRETETGPAADIHEGGVESVSSNPAAPLAVLFEVAAGADMLEVYSAIEHTSATWPGVPLVGCRRPASGHALATRRTVESSTLYRLGFRAIADRPAQLPALLRELEERGGLDEKHAPAGAKAEMAVGEAGPARIRASSLRPAFELVAALHFAADQKTAAHIALEGLTSMLRADRWSIFLAGEVRDGAAVALEFLATRRSPAMTVDAGDEGTARRAFPSLAENIFAPVVESKTARDAAQRTEIIRRTEQGRRILAAPLVSGERVLGVVEAVRESADARPFTKSDAILLGALAAPVAAALANSVRIAEAERLSQTDDLTKLHNAKYLRQFLVSEIRRARRYGSSVTALFLDLDNFKLINDEHGHLVGSHVLMEMAGVILSSVRDTDIVARYGGDEFVVVLPETGLEQAGVVAERVREKIEQHSFTGGRGLRLRMTASFGVACFPRDASSPQQLIASADSAMYEAKAARKNCIRYTDSPSRLGRREKAIS